MHAVNSNNVDQYGQRNWQPTPVYALVANATLRVQKDDPGRLTMQTAVGTLSVGFPLKENCSLTGS